MRTRTIAVAVAVVAATAEVRADSDARTDGHWAFQPLADPAPPATGAWARTDIDRFVQERLARAGLEPGPDAAPRTLLRRLHFQLVGLPPTPEELEAFCADPSPAAVAATVDRLLASPGFGERWGRHWLDLARYADSNGLDENFLFREAWRYRNWVIDAVNADLPFDRFVLEQIAGDLLPFDSPEQRDRQRTAAGFLAIGPKVLLGNDPDRQRMEVADEQIDTIGRGLLGLTLGCARCHDHKSDPVTTREYYALAGVFTSTEVMETRHMLGEQRRMERLVGLGADGHELDDAYELYWRERPQKQQLAKQAKAALAHLENGETSEAAALAEAHAGSVDPEALDPEAENDAKLDAQRALVASLDDLIANPPPIPPRVMAPADVAEPKDDAVRVAGQFDHAGEIVPRGFLSAAGGSGPPIPEGSSGRAEFARWLTDSENGAGHLTARVTANRVWHHLTGQGLVRTTDNFGTTGEPPSHPDLLDYLAGQLVESGWSIRSLVRLVATSRTFGLDSAACDTTSAPADPDNRLLWRGNRRRLDPESLRDAMLATSGTLELGTVGSTVGYLGDQATAVGKNEVRRRTDFLCRSVYLPVIRNDLPELFEAFDFADPHSTTGSRPVTNVPKQALFTMNDPSVEAAARALAERLIACGENVDDTARAVRLFELVTGSPPTDRERELVLGFVAEAPAEGGGDPGAAATRLELWTNACHAIYASSRFQYLD